MTSREFPTSRQKAADIYIFIYLNGCAGSLLSLIKICCSRMYFCISFTFYLSTCVGASCALSLLEKCDFIGTWSLMEVSHLKPSATDVSRIKIFLECHFILWCLVTLWLILVFGQTRKTTAPHRWMLQGRLGPKSQTDVKGLFWIHSQMRWWFNSWSCSGHADRTEQRPDPNSSPERCSQRGCWCHKGYGEWRRLSSQTTVPQEQFYILSFITIDATVLCQCQPFKKGYFFGLFVNGWWSSFCCCFRSTDQRVTDDTAKVHWTGWYATVATKAWISQQMTFDLYAYRWWPLCMKGLEICRTLWSQLLYTCFCSYCLHSTVFTSIQESS